MDATEGWRRDREELGYRVEEMRLRGVCDTCYDLEAGGELYGDRYVLHEDDLFKVKLEGYPRARISPSCPRTRPAACSRCA